MEGSELDISSSIKDLMVVFVLIMMMQMLMSWWIRQRSGGVYF